MRKGREKYFPQIRIPVPRPGHAIRSVKDYDRKTGKQVSLENEGDEDE